LMGSRKISTLSLTKLCYAGGDLLHPNFSRLLRAMHVPAYPKRKLVNNVLSWRFFRVYHDVGLFLAIMAITICFTKSHQLTKNLLGKATGLHFFPMDD
jgi:hypothetical protein